MDLYLTALALGAVGLIAMAFSGLGRHARPGVAGHSAGHGGAQSTGHGAGHLHGGSNGDAGGHGQPGMPGHAGPHGHAGTHGHAGIHGQSGTHGQGGTQGHTAREGHTNPLLALMSPRLLFSVSLGLGTTGILLRPVLSGPLLFAAALAAGILFERFLVAPIWNFAFRFASNPALTLESALADQATAVTTFDANGHGLIAVELDGQRVQLLGTLQSSDREMHVRVPAGARLRIEEVDSARNRCIVSLE